MMVYASKDGNFGFDVVSIGTTDTLTIILCRDAIHRVSNAIESYNYDIIPPVEKARIPEVSAEMRAENNRRQAIEDSIRNAYVARCVAAQNEGDYDKEIMAKTWGNYQTIKDFIDYARDLNREDDAYTLLHNLTDKDLRDVSIDVLKDCFDGNMLNPRVSNEMLRPFVETFHETSLPNNVSYLIQWVSDSITVDEAFGESRTPISPAGVMHSRVADSHSRDIFFVVLARTAGIPSRIDPVTGKVQYFDNQWIDVDFIPVETRHGTSLQKPGTLVIDYQGADDPRYYTHFSIKKFNGNTFDILAYDAMDPGMDVGMTLSQMMANGGITLDPGYYALSFGPRLADGSVLNRLIFFWIESGETTTIKMKMRQPIVETFPETSQNIASKLRVIAYLDGGSEPTTHAMQEISILKDEFEKCGDEITFYFKDEGSLNNFKLKNFNELPQNIVFEINDDKPEDNLPVFRVVNDNNEIMFEAKGYQIGLGEQILRYFPTGH